MRLYNSTPTDIKPSLAAAKIHYAEAFDNYFALLLREIKSATLPAMFTDALEVEANMMACGKIKQRVDVDRRKGREEIHSTSYVSSSNDIKFEMMLNTMKKLMDKLTVENIMKKQKRWRVFLLYLSSYQHLPFVLSSHMRSY